MYNLMMNYIHNILILVNKHQLLNDYLIRLTRVNYLRLLNVGII